MTPFPTIPDKHSSKAVFTAADMLAHRRRAGTAPAFDAPDLVLFCLQAGVLEYAVQRFNGRKCNGFYGDTYLLDITDRRIAIVGRFGVGAPVMAVLTEDFAALGATRFVALGMAGGLQPAMQTGDLVVCTRAIRDEGTSHHYLPPAKYVAASPPLTRRLCQSLDAGNVSYSTGTTWTTDAPYRETRREVEQFQSEGVKTVEMEAAALFAVAQYCGVEAAAAFAIGDTLDNSTWSLDVDMRRTQRGLERLCEAVTI